jgi:hypothetical protein
MKQKELVCQGALCQCKFGTTPDKFKVLTQTRYFINDKDAKEKLMATHMDIGMTFEKNTFGSCKMTNNSPCVPALLKWDGYYEKLTIEENQGKALVEDSKGTCAIAGSPCIEFMTTGQIAEPSQQNIDNGDEELLSQVNPMVNAKEMGIDEKLKTDFQF